MEALEVLDIISKGEDSKHQFKENFSNANSLASEMVAFSNSEGGMIVIGISDDKEIIGLSTEDINRLNNLISNTATNNVKNPINVKTEINSIENKNILLLFVEKGIDKPYMDNNSIIWVKNGADKRKVTSREEMRRMFQSSDLISSDKMPIEGTSINDIDKDLISEFYLKENEENISELDIPLINYLQNSNLAKDGKINLAGLLMFGENPQLYKPEFIIKAVSFVGNEDTSDKYRDSEDIKGNLQKQYQDSLSFVTRNLHKIQKDKNFNSVGDIEIPEVVFIEIIVNSLIHRDYFISSPIRIFIFDDRIEIISPGSLPNSLTIENIKTGNSLARNPILISFGTKILPYRGIGTGVKRAIKYYKNIEFINDIDNNQFKVIILRPKTE